MRRCALVKHLQVQGKDTKPGFAHGHRVDGVRGPLTVELKLWLQALTHDSTSLSLSFLISKKGKRTYGKGQENARAAF